MSNELRGETTLTLGGQKRLLKFSLNALRIAYKELGIELGDVNAAQTIAAKDPYRWMGALVWAGLKNNADYKGEEFKTTPEQVAAWLDDMTEEDMNSLTEAIAHSRVLGKSVTEVGEVQPGEEATH